MPGVESATVANSMPLHIDQSGTTTYPLPSRDPDSGESAASYRAAPGFFTTLQIPMLAGRDFNDLDTRSSAAVAVINRALAERLFGDANAVGRQLREGRGGTPVEIVGVVEDGKYTALGEARRSALFRPIAQRYSTSSLLIVRSASAGQVRPEDLRRLLRDIDPNLPVRMAATGDDITILPLLPYRVAVAALGLLGLICSGLLLSGLHAMLAYVVSKRQREIGIRVALGAGRSNVILTVLARVFVVLAVGVAMGSLLAAGTGPMVSSMVLGVSPSEPLILLAIAAGLAAIALASCFGPVRKSLMVDPATALRQE